MTPSADSMHTAGLPRRLAAIVYDSLLLLALWMAGGAAYLAARGGDAVPAGDPAFRVFLLLIALVFFVGFWSAAGRTLGMQAWRLRVVNGAGERPTPAQAIVRFVVAIASWLALGLGFLWALFDVEGRTWHDMASGTRLVALPKRR